MTQAQQGMQLEAQQFEFLLQTDGERIVIHKGLIDGFSQVGAPVQASGFYAARQILAKQIEDLNRIMVSVKAGAEDLLACDDVDDMHDDVDSAALDGLFSNLNDALRFAFGYQGATSHTPMTCMHGSSAGNGKGLVGMDGAAQAGMLLSTVDRVLTPIQRKVIMVRYGAAVMSDCPCCDQPVHAGWWRDAVSSLAMSEGLRDLAKPLREAIVMKTVGRQKIQIREQASNYDVAARSLRRRIAEAKQHFAVIENQAVGMLHAAFADQPNLIRKA